MGWWNRKPKAMQAGSVLFRGRWPARPEDFAFLERHGVTVRPSPRGESGGWSAALEHRDWGRATLVWMPDAPLPSRELIDWDPRLTAEEKALAHQCGSMLGVTAEARTGNVLADRKDLLRFLHAVMGEDGLCVMDHGAQAFWSRQGLEAELVHGAELDIDAIYTMHLLREDRAEGEHGEAPVHWLHTHGLKEIGCQEFDILQPSPDLWGHAHDILRALAFAVVEGRLTPGGEAIPLITGEAVRTVGARSVLAQTPQDQYASWRTSMDEDHLEGHAVVCDPVRTGLLARLLGRQAPRPSRFLQGPFPEEVLIQFSHSATELMARRARQMLPLFRELVEELRALQLPTLVKLGYPVDGGGESDREHLWFEVHGFQGDAVDATLINQPFHIARLQKDTRGLYPLELLSDWVIFTPIGRIDPRSTRVLRTVREHRDALTAALAEMQAAGAGRGPTS